MVSQRIRGHGSGLGGNRRLADEESLDTIEDRRGDIGL
jgi:hypothetical protein